MSQRNTVVAMLLKYGAMLVLVAAFCNVYFVLRYFEVARRAARLDSQLQAVDAQRRSIEAVLGEFASRANSDPAIMRILQRAQQQSPAAPAR